MIDWLGRVVMLVLAGMVTLSIIGSIAAIPSGTIPARIGMEPPAPIPAEAADEPLLKAGEPQQRARPDRAAADSQVATGQASAPPEAPDAARWLEAITYALLALVGLAALACLLIWRGLRRIAEELARARP